MWATFGTFRHNSSTIDAHASSGMFRFGKGSTGLWIRLIYLLTNKIKQQLKRKHKHDLEKTEMQNNCYDNGTPNKSGDRFD